MVVAATSGIWAASPPKSPCILSVLFPETSGLSMLEGTNRLILVL